MRWKDICKLCTDLQIDRWLRNRHHHHHHNNQCPPPPPPQSERPPPPPPPQQDFVFQHPFTAIVSGPTSCGKTYFLMTLLQHCSTKIFPPPERILWLYKRWQPLYDVIQQTVPIVDFIQGIPLELDQDSFIHPGTKNLVILDDLMSTAAKDYKLTSYLQRAVIIEICQSWLLIKTCTITKILPRDETVTI